MGNNKTMDYGKCLDIVDKFAKSKSYKYYEVVEDNYEGEDQVLLIIYNDPDHENESSHYSFTESDCKDLEKELSEQAKGKWNLDEPWYNSPLLICNSPEDEEEE